MDLSQQTVCTTCPAATPMFQSSNVSVMARWKARLRGLMNEPLDYACVGLACSCAHQQSSYIVRALSYLYRMQDSKPHACDSDVACLKGDLPLAYFVGMAAS